MNSSTTERSKTLAERLERFLVELANLKTREPNRIGHNYVGARRLLRIYRDFFPPDFPLQSALARIGDDEAQFGLDDGAIAGPRTDEEREEESLHHLFDLSFKLRRAWDEPDIRRREWMFFELRRSVHRGLYCGKDGETPDLTPIEQAIFHIQRIPIRSKHCANPDCLTPYFIAPDGRPKFCTPECALPSQKQFKRDWWQKTGDAQRKNKSEASSRERKGKKHHAKR